MEWFILNAEQIKQIKKLFSRIIFANSGAISFHIVESPAVKDFLQVCQTLHLH